MPFFQTSLCAGILNSAIFNSFHNRVEFGTILEGLQNFGGGGVWTPQPPHPRYPTAPTAILVCLLGQPQTHYTERIQAPVHSSCLGSFITQSAFPLQLCHIIKHSGSWWPANSMHTLQLLNIFLNTPQSSNRSAKNKILFENFPTVLPTEVTTIHFSLFYCPK